MKLHAYDALGRRKYLDKAESRRFLLAVKRLPENQKILCRVLYYSGCRLSEALNLKAENIELSENTVIFRTLKQREQIRYRRIPIPQKLTAQIASIIPNNQDRLIWKMSRITAWRVVKETMRMAKIEGIQANSKGLRHGFGVRSALAGLPLPLIQKLMGHSSSETTSIYLDVHDEEERELVSRTWRNSIK